MTSPHPWLDLMRADLGMAEVSGPAANDNILACFADAGWPQIASDETAWCSAFAASRVKRAGYPIPPRDVVLLARSWASYGKKLDRPKVGAIAVFPRGTSAWQGHVGVVDAVHGDGTITLIGGNQSNRVSRIRTDAEKAIAWRWPVKPTPAELAEAGSRDIADARTVQRVAVGSGLATGAATAVEKSVETVASAPPMLETPAVLPEAGNVLPEAGNSVLPTLPDVSALPSLEDAAGQISNLQLITEGAHAIGKLIVAHPWLGIALGTSLALYLVGKRSERRRLARARRGDALSSEGG